MTTLTLYDDEKVVEGLQTILLELAVVSHVSSTLAFASAGVDSHQLPFSSSFSSLMEEGAGVEAALNPKLSSCEKLLHHTLLCMYKVAIDQRQIITILSRLVVDSQSCTEQTKVLEGLLQRITEHYAAFQLRPTLLQFDVGQIATMEQACSLAQQLHHATSLLEAEMSLAELTRQPATPCKSPLSSVLTPEDLDCSFSSPASGEESPIHPLPLFSASSMRIGLNSGSPSSHPSLAVAPSTPAAGTADGTASTDNCSAAPFLLSSALSTPNFFVKDATEVASYSAVSAPAPAPAPAAAATLKSSSYYTTLPELSVSLTAQLPISPEAERLIRRCSSLRELLLTFGALHYNLADIDFFTSPHPQLQQSNTTVVSWTSVVVAKIALAPLDALTSGSSSSTPSSVASSLLQLSNITGHGGAGGGGAAPQVPHPLFRCYHVAQSPPCSTPLQSKQCVLLMAVQKLLPRHVLPFQLTRHAVRATEGSAVNKAAAETGKRRDGGHPSSAAAVDFSLEGGSFVLHVLRLFEWHHPELGRLSWSLRDAPCYSMQIFNGDGFAIATSDNATGVVRTVLECFHALAQRLHLCPEYTALLTSFWRVRIPPANAARETVVFLFTIFFGGLTTPTKVVSNRRSKDSGGRGLVRVLESAKGEMWHGLATLHLNGVPSAVAAMDKIRLSAATHPSKRATRDIALLRAGRCNFFEVYLQLLSMGNVTQQLHAEKVLMALETDEKPVITAVPHESAEANLFICDQHKIYYYSYAEGGALSAGSPLTEAEELRIARALVSHQQPFTRTLVDRSHQRHPGVKITVGLLSHGGADRSGGLHRHLYATNGFLQGNEQRLFGDIGIFQPDGTFIRLISITGDMPLSALHDAMVEVEEVIEADRLQNPQRFPASTGRRRRGGRRR